MKYINEWTHEEFSKELAPIIVSSSRVAGEGNMNFTYRLSCKGRTNLIAKQAPPFCAKFPSIPAPEERIFSEKKYYELANSIQELTEYSPKIEGFEKKNKVLLMEDLGEGADFEGLYRGERIKELDLISLTNYLTHLHKTDFAQLDFKNTQMRRLNHSYIFSLPFLPNDDVDLELITPGLKQLAYLVYDNEDLKSKINSLGEIYLSEAKSLIHGDFYPRSWMATQRGLFVIDPEFGFIGRAEFDIGVMLAHMAMSDSFNFVYTHLKENYKEPFSFSWKLALDFCCTEILRRILHVAQLPIKNDLSFKRNLITESVNFLTDKKSELSF